MFPGHPPRLADSQPITLSDAMLRDFSLDALASQLSIGCANNIQSSTSKVIASAIDSIANIVCTDKKGNIIYANKLFCDNNNCKLHDIIGKNNNIFQSGIHTREFYEEMWSQINNKNSWRGELM